MRLVQPEPGVTLPSHEQLRQHGPTADYPTMSSGWRTLGLVLGKSLLWGGGTALVSFLMALAVFLFILPRLLHMPDLSAPTFAFLVGYGGLFLGVLLALLLQIRDVLPLSPWQQSLHVAAVIVVIALAWGMTDIALEPTTVGERVQASSADRS